MLLHPDNDHWAEWRKAVKQTGMNFALAKASHALLILESLTPKEVEQYFQYNAIPYYGEETI